MHATLTSLEEAQEKNIAKGPNSLLVGADVLACMREGAWFWRFWDSPSPPESRSMRVKGPSAAQGIMGKEETLQTQNLCEMHVPKCT